MSLENTVEAARPEIPDAAIYRLVTVGDVIAPVERLTSPATEA